MNPDRTSYGQLIYSRAKEVQVFRGTFLDSEDKKNDVAIKVLYFDNIQRANIIYKEVFNMMRFKDIPNVCKIFDCSISQTDDLIFFIRITMKYYANGDLKSLITKRKASRMPFSEEELFNHFKTLVNVFAGFQEKSVGHRDIKPENIFVDDSGELIVGDLGCTDEIKLKTCTIAGTPLYLSPEVRQAYIASLSGKFKGIPYNVFKSDVYSLGITFLYMATLEEFTQIAYTPIDQIENLVMCRVEEIRSRYPNFASYLKLMLVNNSDNRISFIELADFFKPKEVPQTEIKSSFYESENKHTVSVSHVVNIFCEICEKKIKKDYISAKNTNICWVCYTSVYNQLSIRTDSLFQVAPRSNEFCTICKRSHQMYQSCFSIYSSAQPPEVFCKKCSIQANLNAKWIICQNCLEYSCIVCGEKDKISHQICTVLLNVPVTAFAQISFNS